MGYFRPVVITAIWCLWGVTAAYAGATGSIGGTAELAARSPKINLVIKELTQPNQEPWSGKTVKDMNFGNLTCFLADGTDVGIWYSRKYFCVFIFATSYGSQYEVRSTCAGISSGNGPLPAGSFGVAPAYQPQDEWKWDGGSKQQGPMPSGAALGEAGPAVAADKRIYKSENPGSGRIIRAFYSIPCYREGGALPFSGYTPIPKIQPAGTYQGTLTISIVAL